MRGGKGRRRLTAFSQYLAAGSLLRGACVHQANGHDGALWELWHGHLEVEEGIVP